MSDRYIFWEIQLTGKSYHHPSEIIRLTADVKEKYTVWNYLKNTKHFPLPVNTSSHY